MNVPAFPTDNLYKFMALTGLFILVLSLGYNEYQKNLHNIENVEIAVGKEFLNNFAENQIRKINLLSKNEIDISEYNNTVIESFDSFNTIINDLRLKSDLADISVENTNSIKYLLNIAMFFGFILSLSGFYFWYVKLQKYQDIILEKKSNGISNNRNQTIS